MPLLQLPYPKTYLFIPKYISFWHFHMSVKYFLVIEKEIIFLSYFLLLGISFFFCSRADLLLVLEEKLCTWGGYMGTIPKLQQLPKLRASSAYVWLEQRLNIGCICVIQEKSNCVLSAALDWCTIMYGKTDPASISSPQKVNSGVKVENTNVFNFQSCSFQD